MLIFRLLYNFRSIVIKRTPHADVYKCMVCKSYHGLRFCNRFLAMDAKARNRVVRQYEYCINCLAKGHTFRNCRSTNTCQRCNHFHHTLLHKDTPPRITLRNHNHQQQQRHRATPKRPKRPATKKSSTVNQLPPENMVPHERILSEAIKSLATVLCATPTPRRRHV